MKRTSRKLKDLIALSCNVKIYVPSTINVKKELGKKNRAEIIDSTLETFGVWFGGATSYEALGSWVSNDEGLVKERVTIVESFTDTDTLGREIENVIDYCERLKSNLGQEAIALEINNVLHFV